MTPYQLLQAKRDRKWLKQRAKLLERLPTEIEAVQYAKMWAFEVDELKKLSAAGRHAMDMLAVYRRILAVHRDPILRFTVVAGPVVGLFRPRLDDENEMLYLLKY